MSLGFLPRNILPDANGKPLVGAQAFIYEPGSNNVLKDIWLNADFSGVAENPVTSIVATGFPVFYVDGAYDIVVKNSANQTIYTDDNVEAATVSAATTSAEGTVRIATPAEVAAGTAGRVMDTGDIDQMNVDGGQVGGTLGVSTIPNLDAAKITTGTIAEARLAAATETTKGIVEKATVSEANAGTADKFIDAATLASVSPVVEAGSGFEKTTQGGFTILKQFGTMSIPADSTTTTITLPESYGNTNYSINLTYLSTGTGEQDNFAYNSVTASSFKITNGQNQTLTFSWQTMGNV